MMDLSNLLPLSDKQIRLIDRAVISICVLLLVGSVLFIRLAMPFEFPIPWNDETGFTSQAYELSKTGSFFVYGLHQDRNILWMPPGYMIALASAYKVFGYSFDVSRWFSSIFYLAFSLIFFAILYKQLTHWRRWIGFVLLTIALLSPYSLIISNIARMEAFYTAIFALALLAASHQRYGFGIAIVVASAVVHYNAIYFLLPFAAVIASKIIKREDLTLRPIELLALVVSLLLVSSYGIYVLKNLSGFIEDMRFQFNYKLNSPVMGGPDGLRKLGLYSVIPLVQVVIHRGVNIPVILSLFGISFLAMTLNGHNMWYYYGYNLSFAFLSIGLLASLTNKRATPTKLIFMVALIVIGTQQYHYFNRHTQEIDHLKPSISKTKNSFLPKEEIEKVKTFIAQLPEKSIVSFGYTGVEPYFFEDFHQAKSFWTISGHSVVQVFPQRKYDYRVHCDSSMFPPYLAIYDWDGYQRKSQDTGCEIIKIEQE